MRLLKLVRLFVISLILSGGLTTLVIDRADAACCNPWSNPRCTSWWSSIVYGSVERKITPEGVRFRIQDEDGFYRDVPASSEVNEAFENEGIIKDQGFSIVVYRDGQAILNGFAPSDPQGHKVTKRRAGTTMAGYKKLFQKGAEKAPHPVKNIGVSMQTR